MKARLFFRIVGVSGLLAAALAASAQSRPPTTEQLGKDPGALRQEAEQQQSREMQQQQQNSQQQADQQWNDTVRQQQSRANADTARIAATRRSLEQRAPLAPEKNPLLGRWESLGAAQRGAAPGLPPELAKMASELVGGMMAGLCDSMVSRGAIEFRPAGVFAIGRDGRERLMYRAEYRSSGAQVVVLPMGGTTFSFMYIDFNGRDRAMVAQVGCSLARAGPAAAAATMTNTSLETADAGATLQWMKFGTSPANGGMELYVARSSIRRSGDSAKMWDLWDFKTRHAFEGKPFLSARNQYEYDCARGRRRMLGTTGFSGHMGQGTVVGSGDDLGAWEQVGTSGVLRDYWEVACKRQ
jgi:hypothetical protein